MKIYLQRIQKQIWPFILIGLVSKIVFQFRGTLFNISGLKSYLNYADISLNFWLRSFQLFGEFIAPAIIAYCLVCLYILASFHRLILGRLGEGDSIFARKIINPLEEFTSHLSIATLGLLIGISIGAIPNGIKTVFSFLIFSLHPLFFLLFLGIGVGFIYVQNKTIAGQWMGNHLPGWLRSRLDGLYLFLLFLITITFHTRIEEQIRYLGQWLLKLL